MLVETVLSMLTLVCHFKKVMHRGWASVQARLARSPWPPSMCWSNGMAFSLTRRASCPSRSPNLVCKILISLLGLSEINTIGYYAILATQ